MFLFRTLLSFFKDEIYRELLITSIALVALGTVVFHFTEGWSWLDSLYFCVSTVTTTGYGDLYPRSVEGKIFNIFFLFVSLVLILMLVNTMNQHYNKRKELHTKTELRHRNLTKNFLKEREETLADNESSGAD